MEARAKQQDGGLRQTLQLEDRRAAQCRHNLPVQPEDPGRPYADPTQPPRAPSAARLGSGRRCPDRARRRPVRPVRHHYAKAALPPWP
jgi:hypothetical protein